MSSREEHAPIDFNDRLPRRAGEPSGTDPAAGDESPANLDAVAAFAVRTDPEPPDPFFNDVLFGEDGDDTIYGMLDNDILIGGDGVNHLDGGSGHDGITGDNGGDTILGGLGNDAVLAGRGDDTVYLGPGHDAMAGGDGNDFITPGTETITSLAMRRTIFRQTIRTSSSTRTSTRTWAKATTRSWPVLEPTRSISEPATRRAALFVRHDSGSPTRNG
jgi:hypothetical protein